MLRSPDVTSAFDKKELPPPEPGAMCYMMSKQQYLNDKAKNWLHISCGLFRGMQPKVGELIWRPRRLWLPTTLKNG